jgi:LacI family transcriptional regulator
VAPGYAHAAAERRLAGFRAAAGPEALVLPAGSDLAASVRRYGLTALACHHDPQARHAIAALAAAGLRVPEDVSVIGVDAAEDDPGLATLAYPYAGVAETVAAWLAGRPSPPIPTATRRPGRSLASI